ncbi:MAG: hypothetical protein QW392_08715 [Candidatus Jordarchaeales archaeon]
MKFYGSYKSGRRLMSRALRDSWKKLTVLNFDRTAETANRF